MKKFLLLLALTFIMPGLTYASLDLSQDENLSDNETLDYNLNEDEFFELDELADLTLEELGIEDTDLFSSVEVKKPGHKPYKPHAKPYKPYKPHVKPYPNKPHKPYVKPYKPHKPYAKPYPHKPYKPYKPYPHKPYKPYKPYNPYPQYPHYPTTSYVCFAENQYGQIFRAWALTYFESQQRVMNQCYLYSHQCYLTGCHPTH